MLMYCLSLLNQYNGLLINMQLKSKLNYKQFTAQMEIVIQSAIGPGNFYMESKVS